MIKTRFAVIIAAIAAVAALALPAEANSRCRGCAQAKTVSVKTVYRTVYVHQVRDVTRVRNVYRDRVVHARPVRPMVQRVAALGMPSHIGHRAMHHGLSHYGIMHPHWVPNGVTHHAGYHYPGDHRWSYRHHGQYHAGYYPYR